MLHEKVGKHGTGNRGGSKLIEQTLNVSRKGALCAPDSSKLFGTPCGTYTERRSASENCIIDDTHCIVFSF